MNRAFKINILLHHKRTKPPRMDRFKDVTGVQIPTKHSELHVTAKQWERKFHNLANIHWIHARTSVSLHCSVHQLPVITTTETRNIYRVNG